MGSYLSIVNNTPDRWQCKLGPDEKALRIPRIIFGALGSIAAAIASAVGLNGPIAATLGANGGVFLHGLPQSSLDRIAHGAETVGHVANAAGAVSDFGAAVVKAIGQKLGSEEYHWIEPGQSHRWGRMTLSLWQQGTCVKTVAVDAITVRIETLYMRPIFSGSTADSNRNHDIQWWINKSGTTSQTVVGERAPAGDHANNVDGTVHAPRVLLDNDVDELTAGATVYVYPNGTQTMSSWSS